MSSTAAALPTPTTNHAIEADNDGQQPRKRQQLSAGQGQSLDLEDLKYFDWGDHIAEDPVADESGTTTQSAESAAESAAVVDDDDKWGPLPFNGFNNSQANQNDGVFGFGHNYWGGFRSWGGNGSSPAISASPTVIATPLPDDSDSDMTPPGMVRSNSGSLSSEDNSDGDETMSSEGSDDVSATSDAPSTTSSSSASSSSSKTGVTFNEQVRVLPIPPVSAYTLEQRFRMYANRFELRENKVRNKREYEFDNYDWRNATEEHSMAICPMSGELLHPAHL